MSYRETVRCVRCDKTWPSVLANAHPCSADLDPSIVPPEPRADSRPFEPTEEQAHLSPILAACWHMGLTEGQTIEMLWRSYRRQQVQLEQLLMTQTAPRYVVVKEPQR